MSGTIYELVMQVPFTPSADEVNKRTVVSRNWQMFEYYAMCHVIRENSSPLYSDIIIYHNLSNAIIDKHLQ